MRQRYARVRTTAATGRDNVRVADGSDDLDEAAARLYTTPPGRFVAARTELTRTARDAGQRELAAALSGLRRPTTAAWLVNLLAREPGALEALDALAEELRTAQSRLDSAALRALGPRRQDLLGELTRQALALGRRSDPGTSLGPAVREQVTATLTAALASPQAERAVRSGRLVTALSYAGLGEVELAGAVAPVLRVVVPPPDAPAPTGHPPGAGEDDVTEPATPDRRGRSEQEVLAARAAVERAHHALEVAQAALDQARARRTAARRALAEATEALERLTGPEG